jgi:hypothetical protein
MITIFSLNLQKRTGDSRIAVGRAPVLATRPGKPQAVVRSNKGIYQLEGLVGGEVTGPASARTAQTGAKINPRFRRVSECS